MSARGRKSKFQSITQTNAKSIHNYLLQKSDSPDKFEIACTQKETEEDEIEEKYLLGIYMTNGAHDVESNSCLGVIIVNRSDLTCLNLEDLRRLLLAQLASLPPSYIFCTEQHWSISMRQENLIKATQVISNDGCILIERNYDKPKVGIKATPNTALGFIFVDYTLSLREARAVINRELKSVPQKFAFTDCNRWPISSEQENQLIVLDVLTKSCLFLNLEMPDIAYEHHAAYSLSGTSGSSLLTKPPRKRIKESTSSCSKLSIESRQESADSTGSLDAGKQILISYARAEAAEHALSLKHELSSLGFSIYLDVHEIHSGVDWQDSLNYAVSNCEAFVPLVTPRYGETQWTNREVKLADVLGKSILPVSFLDDWPPRCLAIQFATTQYIRWKTKAQIETEIAEGFEDRATDIRIWSKPCVHTVAQEIANRISGIKKNLNLNLVTSLTRRKTVVRSCACVYESNPQAVLSDREGNPLVLLCIHPEQQDIGMKMKTWLQSEGLDVWSSTELDIDYPDSLPCSAEVISLSQLSEFEMPNAKQWDNRQLFQEQADDAGVVLMVLSEAFAKSKTCQQQIFYCEHRKRVIPVRAESFIMPGWMSMLIGDNTVEDLNDENYKESLLYRLQRSLDPCARGSPGETVNEARISCAVRKLKQTLPREGCVYVTGGSQFQQEKTEVICRHIGSALSTLDNVTLVTGGFYGVGETIGRAFYEETQKLWKSHQVWHVLPERDAEILMRDETFVQTDLSRLEQ
ncbi:hypothetical protein ScPMuIL_006368 [Solemya velum]